MSNIKTQTGKVIGRSLNAYHSRVKPKIDELKFKESYQGKIIDCMVGEVDDNYIETPETDAPIVKLEHSKEGLVKIPTIKGKTILVDADGNETDTPAEGCKLVSVGEVEDNKMIILSKNKNLIEKNNIIKGSLFWGEDINIFEDAIGTTEQNNIMLEHCIKVEPNTKYYVQYGTDNTFHIMKYDKQGNHIIGDYGTVKNGSFITNANTHYINIFLTGGDRPYDVDLTQDIKTLKETFMIEKADVRNSYVEGKSHKTEILLDEPLRSLPNGVCDEIIDNKLFQRVGKLEFDGSNDEDWRYSDLFSDETYSTFTCFLKQIDKTVDTMCICNRLPYGRYIWSLNQIGCDYQASVGNRKDIFWVKVLKSEFPDLETFINWLKNNPMEIVHTLVEPVITEMPNTLTLQGFDDTTMYVENSITPTVSYGYNALIPYKEELSKQKEEVETNTLDIENNIIPYLMDMEYNLMLMEDN